MKAKVTQFLILTDICIETRTNFTGCFTFTLLEVRNIEREIGLMLNSYGVLISVSNVQVTRVSLIFFDQEFYIQAR